MRSDINITIAKAVKKDKPAIFNILEQANMHYIPSKEMPELTYDNYFVAKIGAKVVGFCGYKILSPDNAKTELMVVDPAYRDKGIGYKLQVKRMEDMVKKGIKTVITNSDLPDTINWYKKHFGYRQIGVLNKFHEFGNPNIDHWTTLEADLLKWNSKIKKGGR